MYPILFSFGEIKLYSYAVLIGIGIILVMWFCEHRAKRQQLNHLHILDLLLFVVIFGFLGARVLTVFIESSSLSEVLQWSGGGFTYYGGLLLALLIWFWYIKRVHLPKWETADIVATYLPLGYAFGRIGCFLEGCCFGARTELPIGIEFPKWMSAKEVIVGSPAFLNHLEQHWVDSAATRSLLVHPTQLYAVLVSFAIFGVLLAVRKRQRFSG
ncbi:MAG: prolipoprotein diacylglyceryl transferase, partial [bacterium]|nr:prolipoprotein diacylglyceryl transferase [bacterium]